MKKTMLIIPLFALLFTNCEVKQTQEAELPEVEVDVEEGQVPKYEVDWASVNVGTKTKTVKIPKVVVIMEEEEVEVPYIDVDMPDEVGDNEETNIVVEAEVSTETHELEIREIYATQNKLIVISELKATGQDLQDQRVRISDQVILNAPELDVKHYIIGDKPQGEFNNQYTYIGSKSSIKDKLQHAKMIYDG